MAAKPGGARSKRIQKAGLQPRPGEEPRGDPTLSRERIVASAVELLDAHGVNGLTMRGLADAVGSGVMSLYWHVDNKEDVFDLALDSVLEYRGTSEPGEAQDWRGAVVQGLEDWRANMLRHPWSISLLPRRALGPNILYRLERLSQALSSAGVAAADLNIALWTLWNYVMGATITRASFVRSGGERTAEQPATQPTGRYPTIERSGLLRENDWDGTFSRGLDLLLNGLVPPRP
ncbi:MAG: TetR family transcriptional regulator [Devosia sp.]|nr:TetR family transcriptional regulator [Devosia sp.]